MQAYLREIGVDMQIQAFDATVAWGKLATQEFDMFGMSFPYVSSGDALNLYFPQSGLKPPTLVGKTFKRAPKALMTH